MAGLYDRINADDNVRVHYLVAGLKGYGTNPAIFSRANVLVGIRSPLTVEEEADLMAIADALDTQANATARLGYVNQVEAAMIAASAEQIGEVAWRNMLEIS
jgi:hypothetical protein